MHIDVIGEDRTITADVRAYAEYRFFAMLARYAELVRSVRVVLHRAGRDRTGRQMVCSVTVVFPASMWAMMPMLRIWESWRDMVASGGENLRL